MLKVNLLLLIFLTRYKVLALQVIYYQYFSEKKEEVALKKATSLNL
jgi:hypothetical protein